MEEASEMENHLSSASAFVEGGIQDACDDACSICLEAFCSDPSTVTGCKHEFHLQCILEWCQRSSHCPMCWQTVSLKDPASQELLEAVEHERNTRYNHTRITSIFHHPALADSDLQHLPVVGSDTELEEGIFQHLAAAAAAAMGRAHHIARREGRVRSGSHSGSQYSVLSTNSNAPSVDYAPAVSALGRENESVNVIMDANPSPPTPSPGGGAAEAAESFPAQATQLPFSPSGTNSNPTGRSISNPRTPIGQSSPVSQERPGPSESQPFSENLKSRWNAVSMRYKESIVKNTRGWRERLLSRSSSMADIGSGVRREVHAGIATVTRMMERLDSREGRRTSSTSAPPSAEVDTVMEPSNVDLIANRVGTQGNSSSSSTHWVATSGPK